MTNFKNNELLVSLENMIDDAESIKQEIDQLKDEIHEKRRELQQTLWIAEDEKRKMIEDDDDEETYNDMLDDLKELVYEAGE